MFHGEQRATLDLDMVMDVSVQAADFSPLGTSAIAQEVSTKLKELVLDCWIVSKFKKIMPRFFGNLKPNRK